MTSKTEGYLPASQVIAMLHAAVEAAVEEIMEFAIKTPDCDLYDDLEKLAHRAGHRAYDAASDVLDEQGEYT